MNEPKTHVEWGCMSQYYIACDTMQGLSNESSTITRFLNKRTTKRSEENFGPRLQVHNRFIALLRTPQIQDFFSLGLSKVLLTNRDQGNGSKGCEFKLKQLQASDHKV